MKNTAKIVFISYYYWPPHFGGELRIAIERFQSICERGKEVVVFTSAVPGYPRSEIRDGIKIFRSPSIGWGRIARRINRLIFWFWLYCRLLILKNMAALHIETIVNVLGYIPAHQYALLLLQIAKIKGARTICVHSLASNESDIFNLGNKWEKKYYDRMDSIVCVSNALFSAVKVKYPEKAILEPCGIHEDIFFPLSKQERDSFREEHHITSSDIVFSFTGSFEFRKGLDLIIDVYNQLRAQMNWKLWLIGPYRKEESQYIHEEEVRALIRPLEQDYGRVKLWGRIDDRKLLARVISSSDIFLFPTRREGFGIAPLEAMSCGIPVIVSRIPGITDMANIDGITGLYIKPGDRHDLEAAMMQLANNADLRRKMGEQGRLQIVTNFSWNTHIDRWEEIYFSDEKKEK